MSVARGQRQALVDGGADAEKNFPEAPVGQPVHPCRKPYVLVELKVVSGATPTWGADPVITRDYGAVRDPTKEIIVEARTEPDCLAAWQRITWGGHQGQPVPGKPNQRSFSRSLSIRMDVLAELGGKRAAVHLWVIWAELVILSSGTRPERAPHGMRNVRDDTDQLGVVFYPNRPGAPMHAAGKIVARAKLSPWNVGRGVPANKDKKRSESWNIVRWMQANAWIDGKPELSDSRFFAEPAWRDDTTFDPLALELDPGPDDTIYDTDAPNVGPFGVDNMDVYWNFHQWVEWNVADKECGGVCSDVVLWHWRGAWERGRPDPRRGQRHHLPDNVAGVVGDGHVPLPDQSVFYPKGKERP